MKKSTLLIVSLIFSFAISAQDIPQHISYSRIYDFLDELANVDIIDINTVVKPYSRQFIADKLLEAKKLEVKLNKRQLAELKFFLNEFAFENGDLPHAYFHLWNNDKSKAALFPPAFHYRDSLFKVRLTPILGLNFMHNDNGNILKRTIGADFQATIGKHFSIYGSLRDLSNNGDTLSSYFFLNNNPGYEYKEASYGGDFSDSRGGIKYSNSWGSIGLVKDNVVWGDNYHGSNILSGRVPSFPMITLQLKPVKWFELNYIHGWLVSNVLDSSYHYTDNINKTYYRPNNKFIAANLLTFMPVRDFRISVGNSIIYAERSIHAAYLIPIAFYKSIDHTLTKGLGTENQNSQMFMNISSRNINHTHLYGSIFVDELNFERFLPDNKQVNPISFKGGINISNFPFNNIALNAEYTRTTIITYKHSIPTLTYASNSYNLGHYLGDNSEELYLSLQIKPIRGLDFKLSYTDAKHGKEYAYIRRGVSNGITSNISDIISQPSLGEIIWTNKTVGFQGVYEIFNSTYITFLAEWSKIDAYDPIEPITFGEKRMTKSETLNYYTPKYLQGENVTFSGGISFGF